MIYALRSPMMTIIIILTLTVMINALPIASSEALEYSLRSKRSNWIKSQELVDVKGLIKRGVIQPPLLEKAYSAYYFNKRRLNPVDYPLAAKFMKRNEDRGVASSNTKDLQIDKRDDSSATKTIPTANITPAAVNHAPPENNGRAAISPDDTKKGDDVQKADDAKKGDDAKSNSISLPEGVTPAAQGFLFLPVSKPSAGPSKSGASSETSSNASHQTFFFNIASPDGGSVSKFEVNKDDGKPISSPGEKAGNNDATKNAPPAADDKGANSDKTRIIFKPLNDPDPNPNQSKSAPTPVTKPSSTNDDASANTNKNAGNEAVTKGASDSHADDKTSDDKGTNDEKAPTSSQSTVGSNEKKNDSDFSPKPKENKDGGGNGQKGGEQKDDDSSKGKGNQGGGGEADSNKGKGNQGGEGGGGGGDSSKSSEKKSSDGDSGQAPKSQGQNGSGNGNNKGEEAGKSDASSKKTNNDVSSPSPTPAKSNGSGKEDDYYLFPVEQNNKMVELNKGDMVAYVDHPQLAASKANGGSANSTKRSFITPQRLEVRNAPSSTITKRAFNGGVNSNPLKRREIIRTITLKQRSSPHSLAKIIVKRNKSHDKRPILIRSLALPFDPIKRLFSRATLQPGKVGATPSYWNGQPLA